MRLSSLFGRTLRSAPAGLTFAGEQLLIRGGFVRRSETGWTFLPLGRMVTHRLETLICAKMESSSGQEMSAEDGKSLWMIVSALAKQNVASYRDLPRLLYRLTWTGCDACLLHAETDDWAASYASLLESWSDIFRQCQITVVTVEENTEGTMHRFVAPNPFGETQFVRCEGCGYVAHVDAAVFARENPVGENARLQPLKKAPTPGTNTIAALCEFFDINPDQTLKAVFYVTEEDELIFALIRGDLDISEARLVSAVGAKTLQPAAEKAITAVGATPGYASPIGLRVRPELHEGKGVIVVVDRSVRAGQNFVTGANDIGYHVMGANYPRDFEATLETDIAEVVQGAPCARCGKRLHLARGITLGYARQPRPDSQVRYLDAQGKRRPVMIGGAVFYYDEILLAVAESHHNQYGVSWPATLAPFAVHLILLGKARNTRNVAEDLYQAFMDEGIPVLFDDRGDPSPGVKFSDADLIGLPLRVTVGRRSLETGGVEFKKRREPDTEVVPPDQAVARAHELLAQS